MSGGGGKIREGPQGGGRLLGVAFCIGGGGALHHKGGWGWGRLVYNLGNGGP